MIDIPAALAARLASGATTLAWCWRLTRSDGQVFGFTDHDASLVFDGLSYEPGAGLSPGALRAEAGFTPARGAGFGALSSDQITLSDLDNGLWDGAQVVIYRVDWSDPDLRYQVAMGVLGALTRTETGFEVEIAGPSAALDRRIGRVFSKACDATLGDARCGVDLDAPAFTGTGTINAVIDAASFAPSGLGGFAPGWFTHGRLSFQSGANAGAVFRVNAHNAGRIELARTPAAALAPGDSFKISAGCDKQAKTCRARFSNFVNFRGHPHMPGNDVLLRHAGGEDQRDGGKR